MVQHYGYEFIYGANTINKNNKINPFPDYLSPIVSRINAQYNTQFDQLTVNDYHPGDGIASHFDVHNVFEEPICLISLLSGIVMSLKSYKGEERHFYSFNKAF